MFSRHFFCFQRIHFHPFLQIKSQAPKSTFDSLRSFSYFLQKRVETREEEIFLPILTRAEEKADDKSETENCKRSSS